MGGDIVYISSKNSVFAGPNNVAYGATKADQAHQVRLLAAELGAHRIRVNGINPDGVVRGSGHLRRRLGRPTRRRLRRRGGQARRVLRPAHPAQARGAARARRRRRVRAHRRGTVPYHRPAHPGRRRRRRRVPALDGHRADRGGGRDSCRRRRGRPGRFQRAGHARAGRSPDGWTSPRRTGSPTSRYGCATRCTGTSSALYRGVLDGLRAAGRAVGGLDGVGVDTWAVDYGLLDHAGRVAGQPGALPRRPDRRGDGQGARRRPAPELYATTGLQLLPFNTIYQLVAAAGQPAAGGRADRLLLIPTCSRTGSPARSVPRSPTPPPPSCSTSAAGTGQWT